MNQGLELRRKCGIAALASHVIALLVGTYMILTMENSANTWRLIVMVYSAVLFTLFGFFSSTTVNKLPLLSLFGVGASAAALLFSLIFIFSPKAALNDTTVRFAGFAMTSSIGLGYMNLLLSAKREGEESLNLIISFACITTAAVVAFSALGVFNINIVNVTIMKFVTLCVLYSAVCGISVLVLTLMKKGDVDEAPNIGGGLQFGEDEPTDPPAGPPTNPLGWG